MAALSTPLQVGSNAPSETATRLLSSMTPPVHESHSQPEMFSTPRLGTLASGSTSSRPQQSTFLQRNESFPKQTGEYKYIYRSESMTPDSDSRNFRDMNPYKVFTRNGSNHINDIAETLPAYRLPEGPENINRTATRIPFISPAESMEPTQVSSFPREHIPGTVQAELAEGRREGSELNALSFEPTPADFRDLMPLRRKLPFKQSSKSNRASILAPKPTAHLKTKKETNSKLSPQKQRPKTRAIRQESKYTDRGTSPKLLPGTPSRRGHGSRSRPSAITKIQDPQPRVRNPTSCKMSDAMLALANPSLLSMLNRTTSRLLDEYEKDIGSGCDKMACANFYYNQLYTLRFDFWCSKIKTKGLL